MLDGLKEKLVGAGRAIGATVAELQQDFDRQVTEYRENREQRQAEKARETVEIYDRFMTEYDRQEAARLGDEQLAAELRADADAAAADEVRRRLEERRNRRLSR